MKFSITTHPATASADWQIRLDASCEHELSMIDVLGEGAFSKVYSLGQNSLALPDSKYAVKVSQKRTSQLEATSAAVREAEILGLASGCQNVMAICGLFLASDAELLVMEKCECSLYDQLTVLGPAPERVAATFMASVFVALAHIHSRGIVHRDVKAQNIMISAHDDRILLSDFGVAVQPAVQKDINWRCGTPGYIAPEVIKHMSGSSMVDMFAAGVLFYFAVTTSMPFKGSHWMQQTVDFRPDFGQEGELAGKSQACIQLIQQLLEKNPECRLSAEEATSHHWFERLALGDVSQPLFQKRPTAPGNNTQPAVDLMTGMQVPQRFVSPCWASRASMLLKRSTVQVRLRMNAARLKWHTSTSGCRVSRIAGDKFASVVDEGTGGVPQEANGIYSKDDQLNAACPKAACSHLQGWAKTYESCRFF
eukprot:CAMPEP_0115118384 /NCGR_PEP_ID=MMETSP0227-20121206/44461_1 /TAXON_ID=89957 /ORGANISM="Polarella glacialis, Strain CCMP 1383" /LENGTH=422 /DNA_ID=CAMNT_0002519647 /DNA_START=191 /DNA_END=1460 /DNA_ORIENTATION=-